MTRKIDISSLDFDDVKHSLQEFLAAQSHFSGFNFSGSGLSIILDLLAYNSTNNAFLASMLGNEMFLDTAQLRTSIVSRGAELGYVPRSMTSASAIIDLAIEPNNASPSLTLSKYTQFSTTIDGTTYSFYPKQAYTGTYDEDTNRLTWEDVTIKEGSWKSYRYVVDLQNPDQQFLIPDNNVDTSTLSVRVQQSLTDATVSTYTLADDLTTLDGDSKVFFIQESSDGLFEVYFGDGVLGKRPYNGQVVILEYLITSGEAGNNASSFELSNAIEGDQTGEITVSSNSGGGAAAESIESIRFNAPKWYQTQGRSVTTRDYEAMILEAFGSIGSVRVWGGEDGDPREANNSPQFGKVFFSLIPASGYFVTEGLKSEIVEYLRTKNLPTILPESIDVDWIDLIPTVTVAYDKDEAVVSSSTIRNKVNLVLEDYSDTVLEVFNGTWRSSQVVRRIDDADPSILGSTLSVLLRKAFVPTEQVETAYTIRFHNAIKHPYSQYHGAISSSAFSWTSTAGELYSSVQLDDLDGVIRLFTYVNGSKVVLSDSIGTVDYTTGLIQFTLNITEANSVYVYAQPDKADLTCEQNSVLRIPTNGASITINGE